MWGHTLQPYCIFAASTGCTFAALRNLCGFCVSFCYLEVCGLSGAWEVWVDAAHKGSVELWAGPGCPAGVSCSCCQLAIPPMVPSHDVLGQSSHVVAGTAACVGLSCPAVAHSATWVDSSPHYFPSHIRTRHWGMDCGHPMCWLNCCIQLLPMRSLTELSVDYGKLARALWFSLLICKVVSLCTIKLISVCFVEK